MSSAGAEDVYHGVSNAAQGTGVPLRRCGRRTDGIRARLSDRHRGVVERNLPAGRGPYASPAHHTIPLSLGPGHGRFNTRGTYVATIFCAARTLEPGIGVQGVVYFVTDVAQPLHGVAVRRGEG